MKSVTSWLIASFNDNGGIREYQAHQDLLKVQKKTSVCWVRYAISPVTEVTPLRVTAGHHTNGARTTRNTKYPCLMGIYKRITQSAKNRHTDNVMRANHGNGLEQIVCHDNNSASSVHGNTHTHIHII